MVGVAIACTIAALFVWTSPASTAEATAGAGCRRPASPDDPIATAARAVVRVSGDRDGRLFLKTRVFGSGVIIGEGLVATSAHVVMGAANLTISGPDLPSTPALTALADSAADVALLRITPATQACSLPLSDRPAQLGDTVFAIGFPFGAAKMTIARGTLTALAPPQIEIASVAGLLRTDAAIAPGDSGGALISADGALIGVITAKYRGDGAAGEPGFAIPAAVVRRLANRAAVPPANTGEPTPMLTHLDGREPLGGASVTNLSPTLALRYGADPALTGVLIWDVGQGYAAQSGFAVGDVVTRVNDHAVASTDDLAALLASARAWRISIKRGADELTSVYGDEVRGR